MAIITDVRFAHEDGALAGTLERLPEAEARIVRETSTDPRTRRYYLRVQNAAREPVRAALAADHTVRDVVVKPEFDDQQVWGVEFDPSAMLLAPRVTANGGLVIDARSSEPNREPRGWQERWLLPDRDAAAEIWSHAQGEGFTFDLVALHRGGHAAGGDWLARNAITDDQRQALETAFERGYFAEPRETSLEELGEELDLSASAIGGRIKRGMKSLVGATLVVDLPTTNGATGGERQGRTAIERRRDGAVAYGDPSDDHSDRPSSVVGGQPRPVSRTRGISLVVYFEHRDLALSPTIRTVPTIDVGVVSDAGTDPDHDVYFFWVEAEDFDAVEAAFEADHTIATYEPVIETEARRTYAIEYTEEARLVTPAITEMGALVEESQSHGNGWVLTLLLQDHETLDRFKAHVERTEFHYEVFELHRDGSTRDDTRFDLTDAQIEALVCAHEQGYYDDPRQVSLEELGAILGLSQTGVSGRLRRGTARLLEAVFEQ